MRDISAAARRPTFRLPATVRSTTSAVTIAAISASTLSGCNLEDDRRSVWISSIEIVVDVLDVFVPILFKIFTRSSFKDGAGPGHVDVDVYLLQYDDDDCETDTHPLTVAFSHIHGVLPAGALSGEFSAQNPDFVVTEPGTYRVQANSYDPATGEDRTLFTDCFIVD